MQTNLKTQFFSQLALGAALFAACACQAESLTNLAPPNGMRVIGTGTLDETSRAINYIGDINGDGRSDIAIGAPQADRMPNDNAGKLYVVFGSAVPFSARDFSPASLNGSNGFTIVGASSTLFGSSVAGVPDFNGDLLPDFVVGARFTSVYVFYGKSSYPSVIDVTNPPVGYGFQITASSSGRANANATTLGFANTQAIGTLTTATGMEFTAAPLSAGRLGTSVASGDLLQDSRPDLIIGAQTASANQRTQSGTVYVVFGKASNAPSFSRPISDLMAVNQGFSLDGAVAGNFTGTAVGSPGDVNRDGPADLIIGAHGATVAGNASAGQFYIFYGSRNTFAVNYDLATLTPLQGELWTGESAQAAVGFSIATKPGDFNGDGRADVLVGGLRVDTSANTAGAGYLLLDNRTKLMADGFEDPG